jgi:hypothetical protein
MIEPLDVLMCLPRRSSSEGQDCIGLLLAGTANSDVTASIPLKARFFLKTLGESSASDWAYINSCTV